MLAEVLAILKEDFHLEPEFYVIPRVRVVDVKSYYGQYKVAKDRQSATISVDSKLESERDYYDILMHEALHAMFPREGHKGQWRAYAKKITDSTEFTVARLQRFERGPVEFVQERPYRFYITCTKCGKVYKYKNKSAGVRAAINGEGKCPICGERHFIVEEV